MSERPASKTTVNLRNLGRLAIGFSTLLSALTGGITANIIQNPSILQHEQIINNLFQAMNNIPKETAVGTMVGLLVNGVVLGIIGYIREVNWANQLEQSRISSITNTASID